VNRSVSLAAASFIMPGARKCPWWQSSRAGCPRRPPTRPPARRLAAGCPTCPCPSWVTCWASGSLTCTATTRRAQSAPPWTTCAGPRCGQQAAGGGRGGMLRHPQLLGVCALQPRHPQRLGGCALQVCTTSGTYHLGWTLPMLPISYYTPGPFIVGGCMGFTSLLRPRKRGVRRRLAAVVCMLLPASGIAELLP
jgi:hypothetical protein